MPQPTTNNLEGNKKLNKYGCHPSEDVCLEHDSPLISFGFCEDSPDIKDYVKQLRKQDCEELIKMLPKDEEILQQGSLTASYKLRKNIKDYYEK